MKSPHCLCRLAQLSFRALPVLIVLATIVVLWGKDEPEVPPREAFQTTAFLETQTNEAASLIESLQAKLRETEDKDDRDDIEDTIEILEYGRGLMASALSTGNPNHVYSANSRGYRILESVRNPVEGEGLPGPTEGLSNVIWGGIFGHGIPALSEKEKRTPLGPELAALESRYLYDSKSESYYSVEQLAKLTPMQVSELDIRPGHPGWLTKSESAAVEGIVLQGFEQEYEEGVEQVLRRKKDIEANANYDMHRARKILFLKEVYLSATSPKANTEDVYGVDWKIKWGDETAVEPMASRLYKLAGGRTTDLTFANGTGANGVVLILNEEGEMEKDEEGDDERHAETLEDLRIALDEYYGFDLTPFLHSYGTITAENSEQILANLPDGGKKKFSKEKLRGRTWVTFKESMVELKPKGYVRRVDGSTMSDVVAIEDRASRGTYLFDLWIANRDVKDDNNKAYYRKGYTENGAWGVREYSEGHHDLGLSLGSLFASGEVNKLKTGTDFAKMGSGGKKMRFRQSMVFKPESWFAASWADSMWMARKIVGLDEKEISLAVAASNWPDFSQKALVYKLLDRRNRIAELFGLEKELDIYPVKAPNLSVPLGSPEEIAAAERRYQLPPGSISAELSKIGAGAGYEDKVLLKGQVASCERSVLVRLLVNYRFPSGLDQRYSRQSDTLPDCSEP